MRSKEALFEESRAIQSVKAVRRRLKYLRQVIQECEAEQEGLAEWLESRVSLPPARRRNCSEDRISANEVRRLLGLRPGERMSRLRALAVANGVTMRTAYRDLAMHREWDQRKRPDSPHLLSR